MPEMTTTRLSDAQALSLYRDLSLHELGRRAHAVCLRLHPEPHRTYIVDRNINYSNQCTARCAFCAYRAKPGGPSAWTAAVDEVLRQTQELVDIGGCQVLLQGGLHPELELDWYVELLRRMKAAFPAVHVHGFSPPEIVHLARRSGLDMRGLLGRLREAGLDTIPGGGAEILVDRVRKVLSPGKCLTDEWLDVMRQAHALGMRTTATMMFGHIETDAERVEHLRRLRELQDESLAHGRGHFTAFIPWTFQPTHTELGDAGPVRLAGANEYLRTLALARLYLDNFDNLQASWVTQGPKVGQLALFFGANDMGSVMMEERVVSAAGTTYRMNEAQLRHVITAAGFQPRRRNCHYELLEPSDEHGASGL